MKKEKIQDISHSTHKTRFSQSHKDFLIFCDWAVSSWCTHVKGEVSHCLSLTQLKGCDRYSTNKHRARLQDNIINNLSINAKKQMLFTHVFTVNFTTSHSFKVSFQMFSVIFHHHIKKYNSQHYTNKIIRKQSTNTVNTGLILDQPSSQ